MPASKRVTFTNVTEDTTHDATYEVHLDGELVGRVIRLRVVARVRYSEGRLGRDRASTQWRYQTLSPSRMWTSVNISHDSRDRAAQDLLVDTRGMSYGDAAAALGKPISWA